jgi:hypothetical protein
MNVASFESSDRWLEREWNLNTITTVECCANGYPSKYVLEMQLQGSLPYRIIEYNRA